MQSTDSFDILILGGGCAGITTAAHIKNMLPGKLKHSSVAIVEPSEKHYYQPLWTLVGGGVYPLSKTVRKEASLIPPGVRWIKDSVAQIQPEHNTVTTASGTVLHYRALVVALGLRLAWEKIPGLAESVGKHCVCSNYLPETVSYTWECTRNFRGGTAIFTQPLPPIKCGGAPQKIMYLAESHFRKSGVRSQSEVHFFSAAANIFAVKRYADTLDKVIARKQIQTHYRNNLVELRPEAKEAIFKHLDTGEMTTMHYDMIHVTPPQGPLDVVKQSTLGNADGWVDVDKFTLQHTRFPNVFGLGDSSSLPTSKTGAAVRKQAPVAAANLIAWMQGQPLLRKYNGYTSCPLVTGYGSLVMAEFDYDGKPQETFPIDQSKERYSMYFVKKHLLPRLYWHGMLRGKA